MQNRSLYHPENLSMDPRHDLEVYSTYFNNLKQRPIDLDHPMRSNSALHIMKKGLQYRFKL